MIRDKVNLDEKMRAIAEYWHPGIVAEMDDSYVKLAKVKGEFVWHTHDDEDELFIVLNGRLSIQMRGDEVSLGAGELFVVPRGVEHCPAADGDTYVLLIERKSTAHTGGVQSDLTHDEQEWL
jgi:mannose-6-phosphate isomerase-like protein (cupin superfamily)